MQQFALNSLVKRARAGTISTLLLVLYMYTAVDVDVSCTFAHISEVQNIPHLVLGQEVLAFLKLLGIVWKSILAPFRFSQPS